MQLGEIVKFYYNIYNIMHLISFVVCLNYWSFDFLDKLIADKEKDKIRKKKMSVEIDKKLVRSYLFFTIFIKKYKFNIYRKQ